MKRLAVLLILSVLIAVSQVSCGGGGGGGGGNQLPSVALKTSNFRMAQPNESLTYDVSGTVTSGGLNYPVTGTESIIVSTSTITSPINNTQCKIHATSVNITVNQQQITQNSYDYFTQDGSGNYYTYGLGDGSTDHWITSPLSGYVKDMASPMAVGDSLSYNVTYDNGDSESVSYVVVAKEYVYTGIANYESYRVNVTLTYNYASGTITKGEQVTTAWVVPGLDIVKENDTLKYYTGSTIIQTLDLTTTLSATNITY